MYQSHQLLLTDMSIHLPAHIPPGGYRLPVSPEPFTHTVSTTALRRTPSPLPSPSANRHLSRTIPGPSTERQSKSSLSHSASTTVVSSTQQASFWRNSSGSQRATSVSHMSSTPTDTHASTQTPSVRRIRPVKIQNPGKVYRKRTAQRNTLELKSGKSHGGSPSSKFNVPHVGGLSESSQCVCDSSMSASRTTNRSRKQQKPSRRKSAPNP